MEVKLPFVEIEWLDAWADSVTAVTVQDIQDSHKPERIVTRGWLLRQDEIGVSIANEICGDGSFRGRTFVPASMHPIVTELNCARKRKPKPQPTNPEN